MISDKLFGLPPTNRSDLTQYPFDRICIDFLTVSRAPDVTLKETNKARAIIGINICMKHSSGSPT